MSGGRRFAPGWRPEPNEVLDGGIVEDDLHEGKFGPYRTLTIEREDGTQLAVHAYHSVLADELEGIGVGDRVRITYLGVATSKAGRQFHSYDVEVGGES